MLEIADLSHHLGDVSEGFGINLLAEGLDHGGDICILAADDQAFEFQHFLLEVVDHEVSLPDLLLVEYEVYGVQVTLSVRHLAGCSWVGNYS